METVRRGLCRSPILRGGTPWQSPNTAGSPLLYMLGKMLESDGLSMKDVEIVELIDTDYGALSSIDRIQLRFQREGQWWHDGDSVVAIDQRNFFAPAFPARLR